MEYTTLGNTGVEVSEICLGGAALGLDTSSKYPWSLNRAESEEVIERAMELGVNFFDTSNSYSWGDSETVLGDVLSTYDRDRYVVSSKVFFQVDENNRNSGGLSKKTIDQELQNSLERLQMDTLDIYHLHRWDPDTPISVTLEALDQSVREGKVRYLGASSMWTYQFCKLNFASEQRYQRQFSVMQNHYNLVYREEEREMIPFCERQDIAVTPYSPLAQGYLARPHQELETTERGKKSGHLHEQNYHKFGGREINQRVEELAHEKDVSMAQISLSWLLHKPYVDSVVVGISKLEYLEEAVEATSISLPESDIKYLEEPYEPNPVRLRLP